MFTFACFLGMDAGPNGEPEKQNITKINLPHSFEEYKRITNMIVVYIRSEVVKRTSSMLYWDFFRMCFN